MDKLEQYIAARGLKYKFVAAQLGMTYASLRNKLNGKTAFTAEEAVQLKYLLGITEQDFRYIFGK